MPLVVSLPQSKALATRALGLVSGSARSGTCACLAGQFAANLDSRLVTKPSVPRVITPIISGTVMERDEIKSITDECDCVYLTDAL